MPRPALLPVHHPLAFSSPTDGHQNNLKTPAEHSSLANPQSADDKVHFLYERQRLVSLLDEYAYVLDACMVHHAAAQTWAGLFTDDCIVTFPFGTHHGTKGLAGWCLGAETRFSRMLVSLPTKLDHQPSKSNQLPAHVVKHDNHIRKRHNRPWSVCTVCHLWGTFGRHQQELF